MVVSYGVSFQPPPPDSHTQNWCYTTDSLFKYETVYICSHLRNIGRVTPSVVHLSAAFALFSVLRLLSSEIKLNQTESSSLRAPSHGLDEARNATAVSNGLNLKYHQRLSVISLLFPRLLWSPKPTLKHIPMPAYSVIVWAIYAV